MPFRSLIPQVVLILTSCSLAFSQDTGKEIAWRIVSVGNMEIPADWEENRFSLREDGTVAGPFTESGEFHGFEKNGVSTKDYGTYKVTTRISNAKSDCRHQRDTQGVTLTFAYKWTYEQSVAGRDVRFKATSRTVLKLPEAMVLHPPKQLTGRIEQSKTMDAPIPSGGSRTLDTNVTGFLEFRLKNEQYTPDMLQALQAVKSLPIVIEQLPAGSSK